MTDDAPVDHLGRPDWASIDWPPGWTVRHLVETGSTNTDLLAAHDAGDASHRTVFATDHQTAGRGRLDRRWDAPPGANLLTSLLFSREGPDGFACMAMVSLAAIDAIEQLADASLRSRLGLKWPNDLLLDEQKLAGVLAQRSPTSGAIVVGIGLNVSWAPEGAAFVNRNLELDVRPDEVLQKMLAAIEEMLCHPAVRDRVVARYRERLLTIGRAIRIELPGDRTVNGTAVDIDGDGRLLVDVGGVIEAFDVGDVVHARQA